MSYENILFENANGIARITLNRPDRLNSFTVAMHTELRDALAKVRAEPGTRVLLLTGAGRGFCAGQDLADRGAVASGDKPVDLGETVETWWAPLVMNLRTLPMPVVCAVNGVAAGAGANVALAADLVLATKSASFIQSFCKLGLIPDTGGTWILPRLLGTARAMGLAMLGDKLSADQAAEWGLIWKSIEDAKFKDEVEALVAQLAQAPTKGLARTKELILGSGPLGLEEALKREAATMRELGFGADYLEGVAAFKEKRTPTFTGR
ncbi:enoyl-CoA hydratase [Panacagrimonas perspica]|uniref:Enoyl-CoA hydratase n=1 Tax=Panacagrimonas perspica TaxID=381431 RepID=A0A4S3K2H5_9GAMM|nr:2-(1,2-epoxy-1,2-dihydrophenyl)acetyl-CoA isomerase PaaG [Panacagrimonas perspica]TDU28996.1 enoyl-CoA hydratase [Panacagrimonas perspica]THD02187.1 2-(1,2-epoxy-1,2-dihydrophenyl)acetyl-CoA isomerase [Panacagrimonas perspica]